MEAHGKVWKEFTLQVEIASAGITLSLGAIDDSDETWVNGMKAGSIFNQYYVKRKYFVSPEVLKP